MNNLLIFFVIVVLIAGCNRTRDKSIHLIESDKLQLRTFDNLMTITGHRLTDSKRSDSLAFLILPLQASCPSCRKKTIDSIIKYRKHLPRNHFIILSSYVGYDSALQYFRERRGKIPRDTSQLFIDSMNQARVLNLYTNNPSIYYTYQSKAYKKIASLPETIKDDLREFFSGHRYPN